MANSLTELNVRRALSKHAGDIAQHHDHVVDALIAGGMLNDRNNVTAAADEATVVFAKNFAGDDVKVNLYTPNMSAKADEKNKVLLSALARELARYGDDQMLVAPDKLLNIVKLDANLKAANVPLDRRYEVKSKFAMLHLIQ
jgi:hypothetical protein